MILIIVGAVVGGLERMNSCGAGRGESDCDGLVNHGPAALFLMYQRVELVLVNLIKG